ncbi:hypothetical protein KFE25_008632 [Diacronema lutheri]|uniref:Uncharacterized protein n=1 Tax=Diacronema lutheri TaxID=2081491 RepID=A0A8J6CGL0_DIALT|nr:hypothetical protein KFE25_008632 [Diacronema lutheri]
MVVGRRAGRVNWRAWAVTLRDSSSYHIVLEHAQARQLLQLVADGSAVFTVRGRNAVASAAARHEVFNVNMGSHVLELRVRFGAVEDDVCAYELGVLASREGAPGPAPKDALAVRLVDGDGDMPSEPAGAAGAARNAGIALSTCLLIVVMVVCCILLAISLHVSRSILTLPLAELRADAKRSRAVALPRAALARGADVAAVAAGELSRLKMDGVNARASAGADDSSSADASNAAGARGARAEAAGDARADAADVADAQLRSLDEEVRALAHRVGPDCPDEPPTAPLPIARHDPSRRVPSAERLRPSWVLPRSRLPNGTGARAAAELDAAAWWALHPPPEAGAPAAMPSSDAVVAACARLVSALECTADLGALQDAHAHGAVLKGSVEWARARNASGSGGAGAPMPPVVELYDGAQGEDASGTMSSASVRLTLSAAAAGGVASVRTCRLHSLLQQVRWAQGSGLAALTSALVGVARVDEAEARRAAPVQSAPGVGPPRVSGQLSVIGLGDSFWGLAAIDVLTRRSPLATGVHLGGKGTLSSRLAAQLGAPPGAFAPARNLHLCAEAPNPLVLRELWEAPETFSVAIDGKPLDGARAALLARAVRSHVPADNVPLVPSAECAAHIARWQPVAPCVGLRDEPPLTPADVGDGLPCLARARSVDAPSVGSAEPRAQPSTDRAPLSDAQPAGRTLLGGGGRARIEPWVGSHGAQPAARARRRLLGLATSDALSARASAEQGGDYERRTREQTPGERDTARESKGRARTAPRPQPASVPDGVEATAQAYRLALGRLALVELASPAADAAELDALASTLPPAIHNALLRMSARSSSGGEIDVGEAARSLRALAARAGVRCARVVRHSARAPGATVANRTLLALHACHGVHTVMHHYRGKGHKRRYVLFVDAHEPVPVHLVRDSDGGRIDFTRTGLTLKLLLALKPHAALRTSLVSQLVAMPLFEDMTTWNLYMSGSQLVYIDQDSQGQSYDRWLPHAAALISAVSAYRHMLEMLAPEQCGPNPTDALVLNGPWTPLVGSCTRKPPRGSVALATDAALPRCSNALARPNVLCHDKQCRDTFIDCAAAYAWNR